MCEGGLMFHTHTLRLCGDVKRLMLVLGGEERDIG